MAEEESVEVLQKRIAQLRAELRDLEYTIHGPRHEEFEPDFDQVVQEHAEQTGLPAEVVRAEWLQGTVERLEGKLAEARAKEEERRLSLLATQIRDTTAAARDQSVGKLRNRVALGAAAVIVQNLHLLSTTEGLVRMLALWSLGFAGAATALVSAGYVASVAIYITASARSRAHAKEVIDGVSHLTARLERRIRGVEVVLVGVQVAFILTSLVLTFSALWYA